MRCWLLVAAVTPAIGAAAAAHDPVISQSEGSTSWISIALSAAAAPHRMLKNCYTHKCRPEDYEIDHYDEGEEGEWAGSQDEVEFQWRVEAFVCAFVVVLSVLGVIAWRSRGFLERFFPDAVSLGDGQQVEAEPFATDYRRV